MTGESSVRQQREEDQEWNVVEFRSPGLDNHVNPKTIPDYSVVSIEDSDDDSVGEEVENIMESSCNGSPGSTQPNENDLPLSLSDISVHMLEDDVRKQSEDQLLKVVEEFPTTPRCSPSDISIHKSDDSNDNQQSEEDQKWNVVEFRSPGLDNNVNTNTIPDYSVVSLEDSDDEAVSEEVQNVMESSGKSSPGFTRMNENGPPLSLSDISVHILDDVRKQSEDQLWKVVEELPTTPRYSPSSPALSELAAEPERTWESVQNMSDESNVLVKENDEVSEELQNVLEKSHHGHPCSDKFDDSCLSWTLSDSDSSIDLSDESNDRQQGEKGQLWKFMELRSPGDDDDNPKTIPDISVVSLALARVQKIVGNSHNHSSYSSGQRYSSPSLKPSDISVRMTGESNVGNSVKKIKSGMSWSSVLPDWITMSNPRPSRTSRLSP